MKDSKPHIQKAQRIPSRIKNKTKQKKKNKKYEEKKNYIKVCHIQIVENQKQS